MAATQRSVSSCSDLYALVVTASDAESIQFDRFGRLWPQKLIALLAAEESSTEAGSVVRNATAVAVQDCRTIFLATANQSA